MAHITVLKQETIHGLNLKSDSVVVDATYGVGGHSQVVLDALGKEGRLISIDADQTALDANPAVDSRHTLVCDNFRNIKSILQGLGIEKVDAIIADLGWRSEQFENGNKGFSFQSDEPLLMTFGDPKNHVFTAHDMVNDWEVSTLSDIIHAYGEEKAATRIATDIVVARADGEIKTSGQLAQIVENSVGIFYKRMRIHPATKTFQAIRIAVNDELGSLKTLLKDGFSVLNEGGRMAIITFHSLEDRIVKNTFKEFSHDYDAGKITKKPITPTEVELATNPRSRSAKLRIIEK